MYNQQGLINGCLASLEEEDFCFQYPWTDEEDDSEEDDSDEEDAGQ